MPGLKELLARREALQQELEQARQQEADRTLREIVAKMREYKITLQELMGTKAQAPIGPASGQREIPRPGHLGHLERTGTGAPVDRRQEPRRFSHSAILV
jgi:DNA-binding protein H-NS